jgi:hypothetical protein
LKFWNNLFFKRYQWKLFETITWRNTAVTPYFRMYWKAIEQARERSFEFLVSHKHGQCKTNLIYLIYQNTAINTERKWFNHFCLVKQDMLKVWCKFNQILSVFIGDISIWNFEIICFSNDINENYLKQSLGGIQQYPML